MKIILLFLIKKAIALLLFYIVLIVIELDIFFSHVSLWVRDVGDASILIPSISGWLIHTIIDYFLARKLRGKKYFLLSLLLIPVLSILFYLLYLIMAYYMLSLDGLDQFRDVIGQ